MDKWIKCSERMPTYKDGEVLIYNKAYDKISIAVRTNENRWKGKYAIPKQITHWMPRPERPKED